MIRKTFTDRPEALKYQEETIRQGNIAVSHKLGNKFRVYVSSKEMVELNERCGHPAQETIRFLTIVASREQDAVDDALALKKMMAEGSLYDDYESTIDAARIMEKVHELKFAKDVFNFIDNTHQYDKTILSYIEDILTECDYEGAEECAKV